MSISSALVDGEVVFVLALTGVGVSDNTESELSSSFDTADAPGFCPSPAGSDAVTESLRGRPLFRFGDRGGFSSSRGKLAIGIGLTVLSDSNNLGEVLGGRPLFLFNGAAKEFKLDSVAPDVASFPGIESVFLDWFPPRPRPRRSCCCCSPS